jgi:hypothetical protein
MESQLTVSISAKSRISEAAFAGRLDSPLRRQQFVLPLKPHPKPP